MIKAAINKIIEFSNVDGPGNRMTIFFQSCPFKCLYCHNPETINICNNCGECVKKCPTHALSIDSSNKVIWNKDKCVDCDTCIKTCKNLSSPKITYYTVDELVEKIKLVKPYIRGISVSGGESTIHHEFLKELFIQVKKLGLTCLIDSNGWIDFKKIEDLIDISDGVMLDVKAYDNNFHKYLTGKDNAVVLKNLKYLLSKSKLEEVRTVILPNYDLQNIKTVEQVSKIIQSNTRYKLLKYRCFGVRKEGIDVFGNVIVDDSYLKKMQEIAIKNGCNTSVII